MPKLKRIDDMAVSMINRMHGIGLSNVQIAKVYDVTDQTIANILKLDAPKKSIYIGIDYYMLENELNTLEFARILENKKLTIKSSEYHRWVRILSGETEPKKSDIDKLICVTGMTYEDLFEKEN